MRSGVEAPEMKEGVEGVGSARLLLDMLGEGGYEDPMVVLRCMFVVSAEGGGGRWRREEGESMLARQRKHSPVP
jgi:hypothetical protein